MGGASCDARDPGDGLAAPARPVAGLATLVRPVALARQRRLPVVAPLAGLLPEGGLRRGSTLAVGPGPGATSLALTLVAEASATGSWVAAVGLPDLGAVAAAQSGVALERLALVPRPGGQWASVTAALLESVDVVVLAPPDRVRPADARRLAARARERGAVLVLLTPGARSWPEAADVHLAPVRWGWEGLGSGSGVLATRTVEVEATGRRDAARLRRARLLLPGPDGRVAVAAEPPVDQGLAVGAGG